MMMMMMMMMNIGMNRNGSYVISDEIDWEEEEEIPHRTVDVCGRTTRRIYWLPQSEVNSILTVVNDDDLRVHELFYVMIDGEFKLIDVDMIIIDLLMIMMINIVMNTQFKKRVYYLSCHDHISIKSRGTWIRIHLAWWWWLIELDSYSYLWFIQVDDDWFIEVDIYDSYMHYLA